MKLAVCLLAVLSITTTFAAPFTFNNGTPDGRLGAASRPDGGGSRPEIESADDFIIGTPVSLTGATFTGLLTGTPPANVTDVVVEIYRVFPLDSTVPPSGRVPTRTNSPSDIAFESRDASLAELSYTLTVGAPTFTAANSILNGINPSPNQTTLGEGPVTGEQVTFNVTFTSPISLPPDHYFFVAQVATTGGEFFWLSSPRPSTTNGLNPDLQAWIRNSNLDPDWLRMGTDIIGGTNTFNLAFTLTGETVPEPASAWLIGAGLLAVGLRLRRK